MIYELSGGESAAGILKTMYPNGFEGLKEDTNINQAMQTVKNNQLWTQ